MALRARSGLKGPADTLACATALRLISQDSSEVGGLPEGGGQRAGIVLDYFGADEDLHVAGLPAGGRALRRCLCH
jgi:hypothetical protein